VTSTSRIARYDEWRATRYFPGLEGLRAVAALLVVLHHARTHRLWGFLEGWNGVTLFFVLSGFLITTLALREEDEHGALRWRAFVVRRGFRILPIYFASLALYAAVMYSVGFGGSHRSVFTHALPWYLSPFPEVPFFTRTHIVFSLAWSLGIEEKFYLLWPLVAFVLLRKHARGRIGLALVLALVAQLPIAFSSGGRAVAPYSAILVGCLLAFALHHRHTFRVVARLGSVPGLIVALCLLVVVHGSTHLIGVTAAGYRVSSAYYYLPYSFAAALVVASLALQARGSGVFRSRPLRFVGRVSYPLYLTHPIALGFAATAIAPGGVLTELAYLGVGISLSLVLAYGLHRVVERPLIAVGKRGAARINTRRATRAPVPTLAPASS
jgi:peptidoglycan/LPS O-acetylase OafA/YrhL